MSEYQYYEFHAIDRPLTEQQMAELRAVSMRARITATSFTNEYDWGSFKGDPDRWMERYFDAFLYFANWGARHVMLRLPSRLLPPNIEVSTNHSGAVVHNVQSYTGVRSGGPFDSQAVIGDAQSSLAVGGEQADLDAGSAAVLDGVIYCFLRNVVKMCRLAGIVNQHSFFTLESACDAEQVFHFARVEA